MATGFTSGIESVGVATCVVVSVSSELASDVVATCVSGSVMASVVTSVLTSLLASVGVATFSVGLNILLSSFISWTPSPATIENEPTVLL